MINALGVRPALSPQRRSGKPYPYNLRGMALRHLGAIRPPHPRF